MNKLYVVIEHRGEYEDTIENIIGVCSSLELADELKSKVEDKYNSNKCSISAERWDEMWTILLSEDFDYEDTVEGMKRLFPEESEEELERAVRLYDDYYSQSWVDIEEINYYTSSSEIKNGNIS